MVRTVELLIEHVGAVKPRPHAFRELPSQHISTKSRHANTGRKLLHTVGTLGIHCTQQAPLQRARHGV